MTLYSGMLKQFHNLIMRKPALLWVPMVPTLSSYSLMTWFIEVGWVFSNVLKTGLDQLVQSVKSSIGPWSGLVELLSQYELWIGIELVVEPSNRIELGQFGSTNFQYWAFKIFWA